MVSTHGQWGEVEARKAATGEFPSPSSENEKLYLAWVRECDARACHSATLRHGESLHPLLKIRALMFRGELERARELIEKLETPVDSWLERSRLAAFDGDWPTAQASATLAYETSPETISRLAALQIRAISSFELGQLLEARHDLIAADSLSEVFPHGVATHYARVLNARLTARDQGVPQALLELGRLWDRFKSSPPTADQVHALVFGEIDILKWSAQAGSAEPRLADLCLASWAMTEAMGERLYEALAAMDCAVLARNRAAFRARVQALRRGFRRIDRLCAEVFEGRAPTSASAELLRALAVNSQDPDGPVSELLPPQFLLALNHGWVFRLKPWTAVSIEGQEQVRRVLRALAPGALPKEQFFGQVWGKAKYSSRLHDRLISFALNRVGKIGGIRCGIRGGRVQILDRVGSL